MDAHVEHGAAAGGREAHEESARIVLVGGLRTHQEGPADQPGFDLVPGIAIARVETAHEADHDFLLRVLRRLLLDLEAIRDIQRQRLFREHVLAGLQALDDLVGVQGRRRHQEHRVESRMREQVRVVPVQIFDVEFFPGPFELGGNRAAGRHELGAESAMCKIQRMALSHTPDAGNTYTKRSVHFICLHKILTAEAQRRKGNAKEYKMKERTGTSVAVTVCVAHAMSRRRNGTLSTEHLPTLDRISRFLAFLCASFAPLRLCG